MTAQVRKVLFITPYADISGSGISLLRLVERMDRRRICPTVVLPNEGFLASAFRKLQVRVFIVRMNRLEKNPLSLARFLGGLPGSLSALWRVQKDGTHVIYSNSLINVYGGLLSVLCGKRCVYHIHESRGTYPHWYFRLLCRFVQAIADRIIAVSYYTASAFHRWPGKVIVVYNGVDLARFDCANRPHPLLQQIKASADSRVVTLIGSFGKNKGQIVLVEGVARLARRRNDLHCVFVGKVAPKRGNREYFRAVQQMAMKLGLDGRVHYLGVLEDVAAVLAGTDVLVVASFSESHPVVILEAMAMGVPVVASNVGGIPETIVHGENGLLFPRGDSVALSQEIARVLDDPALREHIIRNARRSVEQKFTVERAAKQIESLLLHT